RRSERDAREPISSPSLSDRTAIGAGRFDRNEMSGPAAPLEPLAPSPYASVIYSAPRTRPKGGPKQPLPDLRVRPGFASVASPGAGGDPPILRAIRRGDPGLLPLVPAAAWDRREN